MSEIWVAGADVDADVDVLDEGPCPSRITSCSRLSETGGVGGAVGSDSTGLMHATPGEMKSFRSSAERIADMVDRLVSRVLGLKRESPAKGDAEFKSRNPDGRLIVVSLSITSGTCLLFVGRYV